MGIWDKNLASPSRIRLFRIFRFGIFLGFFPKFLGFFYFLQIFQRSKKYIFPIFWDFFPNLKAFLGGKLLNIRVLIYVHFVLFDSLFELCNPLFEPINLSRSGHITPKISNLIDQNRHRKPPERLPNLLVFLC